MSEEHPTPETQAKPVSLVASVLEDGYAVVINCGARDGIKEGQKFLIYEVSAEDVRDPVSGESLGRLEIVKGTGTVSHLQERMATVTSDRRSSTRRLVKRPNWGSLVLSGMGGETEEYETHSVPFKSPKVGDYARPI